MKMLCLILSFVLLVSATSYAQNEQAGAGSGSGSGSGSSASQGKATTTTTAKTEESNSKYPWVRTLTNVQIELTLTDQTGSGAPEKRTVSMIVSSGNWGKIRSAASVMPVGGSPYGIELNVDARPFVSVEGPVQLELTLVYAPPVAGDRDSSKSRPTGINQSLTVVLQSGKPLIVSQAADPAIDRRVVVELKATVLK
jgi:hypothetical protein